MLFPPVELVQASHTRFPYALENSVGANTPAIDSQAEESVSHILVMQLISASVEGNNKTAVQLVL